MTGETRELTMKALKPFWGRVLAVESPVDEETRGSGLIVPVKTDGVVRGVVQDVDSDFNAESPYVANRVGGAILEPGLVIYFREGHDQCVRIGDVYVIDPRAILAYETDA